MSEAYADAISQQNRVETSRSAPFDEGDDKFVIIYLKFRLLTSYSIIFSL